ncbi:fimbria/pilus periplasmic chaperone [Citrobacter freundii]|nr:fimbria/pilus periplasmic chaperone [Citrobacter freundii]
MKLHRFFSATALLLATGIPATYASIQINTTRVIYHAAEKDISVQITNPGKIRYCCKAGPMTVIQKLNRTQCALLLC